MLTIGVTGHRFLNEIEKLKIGIDQTLQRIEEFAPGQVWSVLSPLAEGADRLVVTQIWKVRPETRLIVPLPLPINEYIEDFQTQSSREEFHRFLERAEKVIVLPPASSRRNAYHAVGKYLVKHAQVLMALWNGLPAKGQGGTQEIVALARQRSLPLVWVQCGNRSSLGESQGLVSVENFHYK